jgi:FtsP/CotA-like multicopper oxidase with cupredoxin domain
MMTRRDFLIDSARVFAGTYLLARSSTPSAQPRPTADYTIRIAPIGLEIAPGKIVRTTAFNGKVPGDLIRIREGRQVTIDVINETDSSDIVHWHGLQIPSLQDGATEEGSPEVAPSQLGRIRPPLEPKW